MTPGGEGPAVVGWEPAGVNTEPQATIVVNPWGPPWEVQPDGSYLFIAVNGTELRAGGPAAPTGAAGLPCLLKNICNERDRTPSPGYVKRTAETLARNVAWLVQKYGVERVGFLTLTFADDVQDSREAQRRYHSLRAGVLGDRYAETVKVYERQASGRIHYHLLVVCGQDIRTGLVWSEVEAHKKFRGRRRILSANQALRDEWQFWRATSKEYRFGRVELLPVKTCAEAMARYCGKYLTKDNGKRQGRDKGVRRVEYQRSRTATMRWAWNNPGGWAWRRKVEAWAAGMGLNDYAQLSEKLGPRWAYDNKESIMRAEPLPETVYPTMKHAWACGYDLPMEMELKNFTLCGSPRAGSTERAVLSRADRSMRFDVRAWGDNPEFNASPQGRFVNQVRDREREKDLLLQRAAVALVIRAFGGYVGLYVKEMTNLDDQGAAPLTAGPVVSVAGHYEAAPLSVPAGGRLLPEAVPMPVYADRDAGRW